MNVLDKLKNQANKNLSNLQKRLSQILIETHTLQKEREQIESAIKLIHQLNGTPTDTEGAQNNNTVLIGGHEEPQPETIRTLTPCSADGVAIGRRLKETKPEGFNASDLRDSFPSDFICAYQTPYTWIAQWKSKSWIETLTMGNYKIKDCFGQ